MTGLDDPVTVRDLVWIAVGGFVVNLAIVAVGGLVSAAKLIRRERERRD